MKKNVGFGIITVILVLISFLCIGGAVSGQSTEKMRTKEQFYVDLENQYISEIRDMLNEEGYVNCGIMLTRTVLEDGSREYHMNIHHKRLAKLTETESSTLKDMIREKAFMKEEISFVITFG
ncbi:MAG: hypothetical protein ACI4EX_09450 [Lachnospiraceae bacterium]